MKTNLKKQNRRGKEEGEQPDTQVDDDYLGMGQLELYNFKKKGCIPRAAPLVILDFNGNHSTFSCFNATVMFVFHFQIQE